MPTLKQEGNEAFKQKRYKEAAKYYEQYVQQQHSDNKNAYFNLGLCFSKLGDHIKSIEACKNATVLDPTYDKAFYRLMKEYYEINNHYEVFINAHQYIKHTQDPNSQLITQVKEYMQLSKQKLKQTTQRKRPQSNQDLATFIDPLKPILENNPQFNQQIDKYPSEWIEQWQGGIQSEDAKWQQIAYIARQINPQYGINLAYYYYNQIKRTPQGKIVYQQIKELKKELNLIETIDYQDSSLTYTHHSQNQQERKEINIVQDRIQTNVNEKAKKAQMHSTPSQPIQSHPSSKKENKIQDLLQSKASIKKQYEQIQKPQPKVPIVNTKTIVAPPITVQQKINPKPKQQAKTEQQRLQQLYQQYCGKIQKSKDIFNQVYRSIYQILKEGQQQMKGKLLMLLKKRVKKIKVIIASLSDNEQRAVYDMLKKSKMQEYAVDFAPAYYKL